MGNKCKKYKEYFLINSNGDCRMLVDYIIISDNKQIQKMSDHEIEAQILKLFQI